MGFFSWQTADSEESILNVHTGQNRTVYLLQPNGPAIREDAYEGYGVFGGVDAHVWLAKQNVPADRLAGLTEERVRHVGIHLECGNVYFDTVTKTKHSFASNSFLIPKIVDPEVICHGEMYDRPIAAFDGKTANELIESGRVIIMKTPSVAIPLKFSFRESADYSSLPESNSCPVQGFFVDEEEDLDEADWEESRLDEEEEEEDAEFAS